MDRNREIDAAISELKRNGGAAECCDGLELMLQLYNRLDSRERDKVTHMRAVIDKACRVCALPEQREPVVTSTGTSGQGKTGYVPVSTAADGALAALTIPAMIDDNIGRNAGGAAGIAASNEWDRLKKLGVGDPSSFWSFWRFELPALYVHGSHINLAPWSKKGSGLPPDPTTAYALVDSGVPHAQALLIHAIGAALSTGKWTELGDPMRPTPIPGRKEAGGQAQYFTTTVVGFSAIDGTTLSIFHDPAAAVMLRMLGVRSGDVLAQDAGVAQSALLWVILNQRADLLDSFTIGPLNYWLARTPMYRSSGRADQPDTKEPDFISSWQHLAKVLTLPGGDAEPIRALVLSDRLVERHAELIDPLLHGPPRGKDATNLLDSCLRLMAKRDAWDIPGLELNPRPLTTEWTPNGDGYVLGVMGGLTTQVAQFFFNCIAEMENPTAPGRKAIAPGSWMNIIKPTYYNQLAEENAAVTSAFFGAMFSAASAAFGPVGGIAGVAVDAFGKTGFGAELAKSISAMGGYVTPIWSALFQGDPKSVLNEVVQRGSFAALASKVKLPSDGLLDLGAYRAKADEATAELSRIMASTDEHYKQLFTGGSANGKKNKQYIW